MAVTSRRFAVRCAWLSYQREFEKGFELKTRQLCFIYSFSSFAETWKSLYETCCVKLFSLKLIF